MESNDQEFQKDYAHIRRDVTKVAINNIVFIALLVGLYFANQKYDFLRHLENLF